MVAFAGVGEADKTNNRLVNSRYKVLGNLLAAWGHAGARRLSRLAVITLSSDSHQKISFSSQTPVTPDWVTGGLRTYQVRFLGLPLGCSGHVGAFEVDC